MKVALLRKKKLLRCHHLISPSCCNSSRALLLILVSPTKQVQATLWMDCEDCRGQWHVSLVQVVADSGDQSASHLLRVSGLRKLCLDEEASMCVREREKKEDKLGRELLRQYNKLITRKP